MADEGVKYRVCATAGDWQYHIRSNQWLLHDPEVIHDPQCGGHCSAREKMEECRADGALVGEIKEKWRNVPPQPHQSGE